jgi:hypothetical protein
MLPSPYWETNISWAGQESRQILWILKVHYQGQKIYSYHEPDKYSPRQDTY